MRGNQITAWIEEQNRTQSPGPQRFPDQASFGCLIVGFLMFSAQVRRDRAFGRAAAAGVRVTFNVVQEPLEVNIMSLFAHPTYMLLLFSSVQCRKTINNDNVCPEEPVMNKRDLRRCVRQTSVLTSRSRQDLSSEARAEVTVLRPVRLSPQRLWHDRLRALDVLIVTRTAASRKDGSTLGNLRWTGGSPSCSLAATNYMKQFRIRI